MKIQLPLETWVDVLPFVPRWQLVKLLFQIKDRRLVTNLQFFLTEVGQITFAHLHIVAPKCNHAIAGPIVEVRKEMPAYLSAEWKTLPPPPSQLETIVPEGPMPTNIKDFKSIHKPTFMFSIRDWLYAPRNDGKPRALRLADSFPNTKNLIERIKEDFTKATRPVSFFVYVRVLRFGYKVHWQDNLVDNGRTNERLVIKTVDASPIRNRYFDMSVANFLRQFQRENKEGNSLLENVNLWFSSRLSLSPPDHDNTLMKIMAQLMPTIGKINSIQMCYISHLFGLHNFEGVHNYAQPLKAMLTKTRILCSNEPMSMFAFREWLYTPRTDGKPRALRLPLSAPCTVNFTEEIKMDFSEATRSVSFFIYVRQFEAGELWQGCCLDNACTNERLVIKTADSHPMMFGYAAGTDCKKVVQISRYPMGATKEWIEANEKEIMEWNIAKQNRLIRFE